MKRFHIAWLAVSVLFVSAGRLSSQERTISSDTTWIYTFSSETDSTFQSKSLHSVYDSANIQETIFMRTHVLDGAWQSGTKRSDLHDSFDILSSSLSYTWDVGLEQWNESSLLEFFYDQYGSDTLIRMSNKSGDDWIPAPSFRTENSYNSSDQLVQEIKFIGLPGEESEHEKFDYTLDESGNQIATIRYRFDTDWYLYERNEASYDDQGRQLEEITYSRNGEDWEELAKRVFNYDENGNMIVNEYHEWNAGTAQWVMTSRHELSYNISGEWTLRIEYSFSMDGEPASTVSHEYFYNPSGKLETRIISYIYQGTGSLALPQKEFTQHAGDYFVSFDSICPGETYSWEGEVLQAAGTYHNTYVSVEGLDSMYTLCLEEHPAPASFTISGTTEVVQNQEVLYIAPEDEAVSYSWLIENGTIVSGAENDSLTVRWETLGSGEVAAWATNMYGCSSDTTSILVSIGTNGMEELSGGSLVLYPVPVKDVLRIKANYESLHLELMDASGRMLEQAEGLEMDLSHLDGGLYLLRLKDPDGRLLGTRKLLKE